MSCCGVCGGQKPEADVKEAPLFEELPKEGEYQPPVDGGDAQTAGDTASDEA